VPQKKEVAVVMGSASDLKVMKPAITLLQDWNISIEVKVISAHRTPELMQDYAAKASDQGIKVIIAGAGGAAHLPGMLASMTTLPVIGVPVSLKKLKGLDALLSIVQMPKGVPVATVAIDNSYNAGLLAIRLLSVTNRFLEKKLKQFQKKQRIKSLKSNTTLKDLF